MWLEDGSLDERCVLSGGAAAAAVRACIVPPGADDIPEFFPPPPAKCKWTMFKDGKLVAARWELGREGYRIFDGTVQLLLNKADGPYVRASMQENHPVAVSFYLPGQFRLPWKLGYYQVEKLLSPEDVVRDFNIPMQRWSLVKCEDQVEANSRALSACAAAAVAEVVEEPTRKRSRSRERASPALAAQPRGVLSYRFEWKGWKFDSQLECVHFTALEKMGVEFAPVRTPFDLRWPGDPRLERRSVYTPDGMAFLRLFDPLGPRRSVQLEIKPGPATDPERLLMWYVCKHYQVPVLCLQGDFSSSTGTARRSSAETYGDRERPRMDLWLPDSRWEPDRRQGLCWRRAVDRGFYLAEEASDPDDDYVDRERVRRIYDSAVVDARAARTAATSTAGED